MTYADPQRCPGCRRLLPHPLDLAPTDPSCPACGIPLRHPLTAELERTLMTADRLVGQLTLLSTARALATSAAPTAPVASANRTADEPDLPRPVREASAPAGGVRGSSVPAVLLGLGGLCLGVAAVIFLAVAWTWLGVGGRTAVLVTLTGAAAVGGLALARRGLRAGAEALTALAAVLLGLDLVGARHAGWLGDLSDVRTALVLGVVLAAGSALLSLAAPRLVAPQVGAGLGALVTAQAVVVLDGAAATPTALTVVGLLGLVAAARTLARPVLAALELVAAGVSWLELVVSGLSGLAGLPGTPAVTVAGYWGHAPGWTLLVAALLLAAPGLLERRMLAVATGVTTSATTLVLVGPVLDNGATELVVTAALVAGAWAAVALVQLVGRPARSEVGVGLALAPAVLAALPVALAVTVQLGRAAASALAPVAGEATRLGSERGPLPAWLLVPAALAVLLVGATVAEALPPVAGRRAVPVTRRRRLAVALAAAVVVLGGLATLALLPLAPGWLVLGCTLVGTLVLVTALSDHGPTPLAARLPLALGGLTLGVVALAVATVSPAQVTTVAALLLVAALALLVTDRFPGAAELGGVLTPLTTTVLVVTGAQLLGTASASVGVPVLLLTGLTALVLPRVEVEAATAVAWVVAGGVAVTAADHPPAALALHLTLAGALVVVQALVHPRRRPLAPVGGLLLALASWVRLADLGVGTPEAYTLPTAAVLLALGVWHLRRVETAGTTTALGAGLGLATLPSLLWVLAGTLDDGGSAALSLRALLLGLACLALVLGGTWLRWAAPLVVGAAVGAVLVLAELAPYAPVVPQWLLLGGAGLLLVVVGVTWEARLQQVRQAAAYVGRLR